MQQLAEIVDIPVPPPAGSLRPVANLSHLPDFDVNNLAQYGTPAVFFKSALAVT